MHVLTSGKLALYFTARSKSNGRLCIGVAMAEDSSNPRAGFTDALGGCLVSNTLGAIDATFFKENSQDYLIWKIDGNSQGKPTPIMLQELDPSGTSFKEGSTAKEILRDSLPWESTGLWGLVEGPWIIHRGDWYYLFYSGSGYAVRYDLEQSGSVFFFFFHFSHRLTSHTHTSGFCLRGWRSPRVNAEGTLREGLCPNSLVYPNGRRTFCLRGARTLQRHRSRGIGSARNRVPCLALAFHRRGSRPPRSCRPTRHWRERLARGWALWQPHSGRAASS